MSLTTILVYLAGIVIICSGIAAVVRFLRARGDKGKRVSILVLATLMTFLGNILALAGISMLIGAIVSLFVGNFPLFMILGLIGLVLASLSLPLREKSSQMFKAPSQKPSPGPITPDMLNPKIE
jgi:ABC-type multidrug transport system fused ATPase/permease subunit